jgi:PAS domain S-box-containing protein
MLFRGLILTGGVEIKCRFCKQLHTVNGLNGPFSNPHKYILILDTDGKIVKTTDSASAILGYSPEEFLEMRAHDLIVLLHPRFYASLQKLFDDRGPTVILFQSLHRYKDKSMSPVHIEAQAFSSRSGRHLLFSVEPSKAHKSSIPVEETSAEIILT